MKSKWLTLFTITTILGIISCSRTYKFDEEDLSLIPYEGKEILVFKSTEHKIDTIFLKGYDRFTGKASFSGLFPDKVEFYGLRTFESTIGSSPNYDRNPQRESLITLIAEKSGITYWFQIKLNESTFYGKPEFTKAEFDSAPITKLTIDNKTYDDVKVFISHVPYEEGNNSADKFYWSVSEGLLGLDTQNEQWRLIKKYVP